ncbi:MAG: hypothetical protein J6Y20_00985 [Lachnospiraceae bacterium]|nr:hypothetical protein [Lachnospiraceae bacterium]
MTTKEQERKVLAQIKKLVESLGEDSYVGTAFEGCFEIAETNIENDWACSMKQRAESAEKKVSTLELDNRDLWLAIKKAKEEESREVTALQLRIEELEKKVISQDDLTDCEQLVKNEAYEAEKEMNASAHEIVTFAEEPDGQNFQQAVKMNRAAASRWNYLLGLKGRINKAMEAGA